MHAELSPLKESSAQIRRIRASALEPRCDKATSLQGLPMRYVLKASLILLAAPMTLSAQQARQAGDPKCAADNGGLNLPVGFCATVFADSLAGPRHLLVAANGDVFVSLQGRGRDVPGGVMGLRDTNGDGRADKR